MKKFTIIIVALLSLALTLASTAFASSYTPEQRAEAERIARSKVFVGPKLPRTKKQPSESLAESLHEPAVKTVAKPAKPRPKRPSFDGTYYYNADGQVVGMRGSCRPCWMVQAGIRMRRCCN